ncbi:MAG: LysM domain-containing protein [Pseudomonadota bacterium]
MRTKLSALRLLLAVQTLMLAACASVDNAPEDAPADQDAEMTAPISYQASPGLTTQQRFREALALLENGNPGQAEAELQAYLQERPRSKIARDLVSQITRAEDYFPEESFTVVLESGESLSTLSKKYLGSVYKFYALARYNNIDVPRNTRIGQRIEIPLTTEAREVRQALESGQTLTGSGDTEAAPDNAPSPATTQTADNQADADPVMDAAADAGTGAIAESTDIGTSVEPDSEPAPPSPSTLLAAAVDAGDYRGAIATLKTMPTLTGEDQQLAILAYLSSADELAAAGENATAARHFAAAAELLQATDEADRALDAYRSAVNLNPADVSAADKYASLRKELADKYHRQASMAFRAQELDTAISIWDRVLEIDENHANAQIYRAQALELKARLSTLQD